MVLARQSHGLDGTCHSASSAIGSIRRAALALTMDRANVYSSYWCDVHERSLMRSARISTLSS